MNNWKTIAPINDYFDENDVLSKSFEFDENLSIGPIPAWIRNERLTKYMSYYQKQNIIKNSKIAFIVKYVADSLGDPDPSWKGDQPRSKQDIATEKIIFVTLAMWLSKPSLINYKMIIHAQENENDWSLRQSHMVQTQYIHENDKENKVLIDDLNLAKELYLNILQLPRSGSVWVAIRSIFQAICSDNWEIGFLIFWIALEALFGTDAELTYRLSLRLSLFIEADKNNSKQLYENVKKIYRERNKIVHGRGLPGQNLQERREITYSTEQLVRKSLLKILKDNELTEIFSSDKRDKYLDMLVFI